VLSPGTAVETAIGLAVGALPAKTTRVKAGKRVVAKVRFVQLGTKKAVTKGSVRCRAVIGKSTKRLRVLTNAFKKGFATCAWRVPKKAKGKKLTGIVAVQIGDKAARRLFVRKIK
jgi:hypothetical protein